jgi:hypothetical protein
MKLSGQEAAYEAARTWALHPVSHPPPGWAQILRAGLAGFVRERQAPLVSASHSPRCAHFSATPLLTLVAAMIAEVCQ